MKSRFLGNRRGAVLVLAAIVMVVLIGMAALAIDVGQLCVGRQRAQNVCDASTIAAVWPLALGRADLPAAKSAADRIANECAGGNNETDEVWDVLVPTSTDEGVEVTFPVGTVTDDAGRSISVNDGDAVRSDGEVQVDYRFAQVIGLSGKRVAASATAIIKPSEGLTSSLFVPLTVSDTTVFGVGGAGGLTFGQQKTLKVTQWQEGFLGPGNFGPIDLPGDGPGASIYRSRLSGDRNAPVTIPLDPSIWADTETGNMTGPTFKGLSDRLDKDTVFTNDNTAWSQWLGSFDEDTLMFPSTWRIVLVPIIDDPPGPVQGRNEVEIIGYAGFFIESVEKHGDVTGRFIQGVQFGETVRWMFPTGDGMEPPETMLSIRMIS